LGYYKAFLGYFIMNPAGTFAEVIHFKTDKNAND